LRAWSKEGNSLSVSTAYRSYTEGRALHDVLLQAREAGELSDADFSADNPDVTLSWSFVLACVVLLPGGLFLCGQRGSNLAVHPGEWTCMQTEIIEPSDVLMGGMDRLLTRLVEEEMPCLVGKGSHKYVGLGRWGDTGGWALVSVLDLRDEPDLEHLLPQLAPDAETQSWGVYDTNVGSGLVGAFGLPSVAAPLHQELLLSLRNSGAF
jgi:hypothetical protein